MFETLEYRDLSSLLLWKPLYLETWCMLKRGIVYMKNCMLFLIVLKNVCDIQKFLLLLCQQCWRHSLDHRNYKHDLDCDTTSVMTWYHDKIVTLAMTVMWGPWHDAGHTSIWTNWRKLHVKNVSCLNQWRHSENVLRHIPSNIFLCRSSCVTITE